MTREELASGDIALLERLNHGPCEVGDVPIDELERLTALGLAKRVLGCCEITRAGQLTYHRHQFAKGLRGHVRVAGNESGLLRAIDLSAPQYRNQLITFLNARRQRYARSGGDVSLPERFRRIVQRTANSIRERGRAVLPHGGGPHGLQMQLKEPQRGSRKK